ncbi:MAG: basic secretory protein-like protein [Verrucomicrobiota bacterium]|jgi:hypothetical protein
MNTFVCWLPPAKCCELRAALSALLLTANTLAASTLVTVGHNAGDSATSAFLFTNVPPPSRNDAATGANFIVLTGQADVNSGGTGRLHDGQVPDEADDPGANFFFRAGSAGGRLEVDLGRACDIKQINTYSWHPASRGPQVYKLYRGDEAFAGFNAAPGAGADLEKSGWKLLASVDTRGSGVDGGQYGVSVSDTAGSVGKCRYLLFDLLPTETNDNFGNTFYSEIDVVETGAPVEPVVPAVSSALVVPTADGYATISIDSSRAPELKDWAEQKLAPALVEWYPRIVAMTPSDGFEAPKKFSVTLRPGSGVAFTAGRRIVVNSTWLDGEIGREAVGSIIHESVHVAQQYGGGWREHNPAPGWLTEGIPDYIRFFKFEPQTHGADIVWLKTRRHVNLNYDGMYRISANFLNYVVEHYDPNQTLIQKVNAACRQGKYTDALWPELTGKTLPELNSEWKAAVQQELSKDKPAAT